MQRFGKWPLPSSPNFLRGLIERHRAQIPSRTILFKSVLNETQLSVDRLVCCYNFLLIFFSILSDDFHGQLSSSRSPHLLVSSSSFKDTPRLTHNPESKPDSVSLLFYSVRSQNSVYIAPCITGPLAIQR